MAETITGFKSIPDTFLISRTSDQMAMDDEPKNPLPQPHSLCDKAYMLSCKDNSGSYYRSWAINIKTMEDLKKIGDLTGERMVVDFNMKRYGLPSIEIYDEWRE